MIEDNTGIELADVWMQQEIYNTRIKIMQQRNDADWMINYLLGVISESGELLEEMRWKEHRLRRIRDFGPNVSEELADITKYIFSMWQLLGHDHQSMLEAVYRKGEILNQIYHQEFDLSIPKNSDILIMDLDGVVADFRSGFSDWIRKSTWSELLSMGEHEFGLHMDLNNGWDYSTYDKAKLEFEQDGGYRTLPPMQNIIKAIRMLGREGLLIFAWTARPNSVYKRIWADTWRWLQQHDLIVDGLYFGSEDRVTAAISFLKDNRVIALEDNPLLARRYAASKIPVILVSQPYNIDLPEDPMIIRLDDNYTTLDVLETIQHISSKFYKKVNPA